MHVKKLERWCEVVCERVENMLPNTPAAAALLSSEALNVVTSAAHSVGAEESECESGSENETHPISDRLSVSLASSIRLTMTIRSRHMPTTLNYRYSHSLANESCSSTVSR